MNHITQPEQTKSKIGIQTKLVVVAIFLIIVSILKFFNSNISNPNKTEIIPTKQIDTITISSTPSTTVITIEQKQTAFKGLYKTYLDESQLLLTYQLSAVSISKSVTNQEQFYQAIENVEKMSSNTTKDIKKLSRPESLNEFNQINEALSDIQNAGNNITDGLYKMKMYIYNENPQKLAEAKELLEKGNLQLNSSDEKFKNVAKVLNVDITQISNSK